MLLLEFVQDVLLYIVGRESHILKVYGVLDGQNQYGVLKYSKDECGDFPLRLPVNQFLKTLSVSFFFFDMKSSCRYSNCKG